MSFHHVPLASRIRLSPVTSLRGRPRPMTARDSTCWSSIRTRLAMPPEGSTQIEAHIDMAGVETNEAYRRSGIDKSLRIVHRQAANYDEGANTFDAMLRQPTAKADGNIDGVHALRDTHHADLVAMFVENDDACGIGWLMTQETAGFEANAFTVVNRDCAVGYYSFGHELGHNQGCNHDQANSSGNSIAPYAHGWRFDVGNQTYRTILSYAPGTRIQNFSNPTITHLGADRRGRHGGQRPRDPRNVRHGRELPQ